MFTGLALLTGWAPPGNADASPWRSLFNGQDLTGWNRLEIRAVGTEVIAILNGVVLAHYDGSGVLDNQTRQTYNVGLRGHLALQIHRGDRLRIRFKDMVIRELP